MNRTLRQLQYWSLRRFHTGARVLQIQTAPAVAPGTASAQVEAENDTETVKQESSEQPWYLRKAPELVAQPFELPELPERCPEHVGDIVRFMATKLNLDEIKVMKPETEAAEAYTFVLANGKSAKHVAKSSSLLYRHVKQSLGVVPHLEGITRNTQVTLRRMKKRIGKKGGSRVNGYYGDAASVPNSWVMVDTCFENVVVHLLTPERRAELNLEELYCSEEEKHLYAQKSRQRLQDNDDIFSGIRYYHTGRASVSTTATATATASGANLGQSVPKVVNPFNLRDLQKLGSRSYEVIKLLEVTPLSDNMEHLDKVYAEFEKLYLENLADRKCLSMILQAHDSVVTISDAQRLATSLLKYTYTYRDEFGPAALEKRRFVEHSNGDFECMSSLLQRLAVSGHKLDAKDPQHQALLLSMVNLAFVDLGTPTMLHASLQKKQYTGNVVLNVHKLHVMFDVVAESCKDEVLFKNKVLLSGVSAAAGARNYELFWNLWKKYEKLGSSKVDGELHNTQPWKGFLLVSQATGDTEFMDQCTRYWEDVSIVEKIEL